jgi:nicotinamide mononucleotide transporter
MRRAIYIAAGAGAAALLWAAWSQLLKIEFTEALGFVTGAMCVWLAVKENIWNWPIGIANNITFAILFWSKALYANMALQGVFLMISAYGWYEWLYGGERHTKLRVGRVSTRMAAAVVALSIPATFILTMQLRNVSGAAPLLDAVTTVMSLAAQFLLSRKILENWYVWIAVDLVYLVLFTYRQLYLTSLLYLIFLMMCIAGARAWRASLAKQQKVAAPAEA